MASRSGRSSSGRSSAKLLSYLSSNTPSAPPPTSSSKPRRSKASSSSSGGSVKESSPREPPRSSLPPLREYKEYKESRRPKETRETRPSKDTREKESREPREITPTTILLSLIAFRLINALVVRTFFQPDEFFQSLEPAWQVAFGKDQGAWMTWVSSSHTTANATADNRRNGEIICDPPCILSYSLPFIASPHSLPSSSVSPPRYVRTSSSPLRRPRRPLSQPSATSTPGTLLVGSMVTGRVRTGQW